MSSGFEGAKGPARVSVVQKFVAGEGGTLAVSFPGWRRAIDVYAHTADGSMALGEANAGLVAEAFNVLHETGLTPRQLAEERAELLEALRGLVSVSDHYTGDDADDTAIWYAAYDRAEAAIALATQRKEPGHG